MTNPTINLDCKRPAVFLDRDGTVTKYVGYVTNPSQIQLIDGAADCIGRLRDAGFVCVLVTNQSAIGRGMLTLAELETIHSELHRQLREQGAKLDAVYIAPQKPSQSDETVIEHPDRKPGPGMLQQAAVDLYLDLSQSWMVGDRVSDVLAGINAGCRSIRVRTGFTYVDGPPDLNCEYETVDSLREATDSILDDVLHADADSIARSVGTS
ncbi:MAG: HAD family hydrolase [Fuerstiella sp.]